MSEPTPSPWIERWSHLLRKPSAPAARDAEVLDLACGGGRHTRWLLALGHAVLAVDRDISGVADLAAEPRLRVECHDLEQGAWPLAGRRFAGIVVTNYLWRPRLAELFAALDHGGVLLYETFMRGHERFGRPSRAEFLLERDELLERVRAVTDMQVIAFEQGRIATREPNGRAIVQRIVAGRDAASRALDAAVAEISTDRVLHT